MFKDSLIALSLANLWFVDVWQLFLIRHHTAYPYYHWKLNPATLLLATMLDVLLLAALLFLAIILARRSHRQSILTIARLIFVLICLLLLINLLFLMVSNPPLGPFVRNLKNKPQLLFAWQGMTTIHYWLATLILLVGWLGISLIIHSLIYRRERLIKMSVTVALILSPFALITFAQATWQLISYRSGEQFRENVAPVIPPEPNSQRRILWLVFDELDFRLSFIDRPATLKLPEFDRLLKESIFAENAYPPGRDTEISLPALINGQLIARIHRTTPNELELTFSDNGQSRPWSTELNIFSRARAIGLNTGLAGWYHPYCRVIGKSLTKCSWEASSLLFLNNSEIGDLISHSQETTVVRSLRRIGASIVLPETTRILFPREPSEWRQYYVQEFTGIHRQALAMATDPNLHLILVHYPIPHPPGIYDRHKNEFSFNSSSGYLDNVALADRVLGQVRQKMMAAGVWEATTVLVTSDHGLRADWRGHPFWQERFTNEDPLVLHNRSDERVPFVLKLAGENAGLFYEPAFNTVLSHDLLLLILSGEISKNQDVLEWLNRHRSISKSSHMPSEK